MVIAITARRAGAPRGWQPLALADGMMIGLDLRDEGNAAAAIGGWMVGTLSTIKCIVYRIHTCKLSLDDAM